MALYDFVIVCHQRSGSHLLASFIDSHPQLCCLDEQGLHLYNNSPCKDWDSRGRIFMYQHFMWRMDGLMRVPKFIHLTRNTRDQAYSCVRNEALLKQGIKVESRAFRFNGDRPQPAVQEFIAPERAMKGRIVQIKKQRKKMKEQLQDSDVLEINYREMTDGSKSVSVMPRLPANRICRFLGVDLAELSTRMVKIAPQVVRVEK